MKLSADPITLAFALGLLGPAAVDEQGLFDEGPPAVARRPLDLAETAIREQLLDSDPLTEEYDFSGDLD